MSTIENSSIVQDLDSYIAIFNLTTDRSLPTEELQNLNHKVNELYKSIPKAEKNTLVGKQARALLRDIKVELSRSKSDKPAGLPNSGNNCFANATLQLLLHDPEMRKAVEHAPDSVKNVVSSYGSTSVQSGQLRALLGETEVDGQQHDPAELLTKFFDSLEQPSFTGPKTLFYREQKGKTEATKTRTISQEIKPILQVPLSPNKPFLSLLEESLESTQVADGVELNETTRFIEAPSRLTVQLNRFTYDGTAKKITTPVEGLFSFTLPSKYVVENRAELPESEKPLRGNEAKAFADEHMSQNHAHRAGEQYELEFFISHLGNSVNSGHYISYARKKGQWFCMNDSSVTAISREEAEKAAKSAYIFRYAKTENDQPLR